jgi:hypothetical protein
MGSEKKSNISGAGFKVGSRVKLKVTKPPCCGIEPKVDGVILNRAKDGIKWTVQIESEDKPKDIRSEDLFLLD